MEERIKELRQTLGLSLEAFADKLGKDRSTVGRMEKGLIKITESNILAICREFNVRREWLETGEGDMFQPTPMDLVERIAAEKKLGPVGRRFLEIIVDMDEASLEKVYLFMRAIVQGRPDLPPLPETLDEAARAVGQYAQDEYLREAEAEDDTKASFSTA